jgi:hypothetical protein
LTSAKVVDCYVAECLVEIEKMRKPDQSHLDHLKKDRQQTKLRLSLVIKNFKGDDAKLVADDLADYKSELTRVDKAIVAEQRLVDQVVDLPTAEEMREVFPGFSDILVAAIEMPTDDQLDEAREWIRILTGGRIDVYQQGEKKPKLGWVQARFKVNLAAVALNGSGIASPADSEIELVVDIRQPEETENADISRASELYDADWFETEIADELKVSRGCIYKWLEKSFEAEGTEKPDGHARHKRIEMPEGFITTSKSVMKHSSWRNPACCCVKLPNGCKPIAT